LYAKKEKYEGIKLAVLRGVTLDLLIDIQQRNDKKNFASQKIPGLAAEFSGTWPGKRGTQFFGANPPSGGRASDLLPEPFS
jgi:hypothetical protein